MSAHIKAASGRASRSWATGGAAVLATLVALGSLSACAAEPPPLAMAISLGTKQCEQGGLQPDALARRLTDAGVRVLAQGCGIDGRMRPAVCGAGDGRIAIFDIPASQVGSALNLGFVRLSSLPDAQREPCR